MLERSLASAADCLVIDLEDSVVPEQKAAARDEAKEWLLSADYGRKERIVRINALDTELWRDDLQVTMAGHPDTYMVPKVGKAAELELLDRVIAELEARSGRKRGDVQLLPIATETAEGLLNIREIAAAPRICAITWGAEDLATDLGAQANRDASGQYLEVFRYARLMTRVAASAAGVQAIDGVYTDFNDEAGLRREAGDAAQSGFDGKLTIHPSQIELVNTAFSPSAEEVRESEELIAAFEENQRAGRLAFSFRGRMVDAPHLKRARGIIERAKALED